MFTALPDPLSGRAVAHGPSPGGTSSHPARWAAFIATLLASIAGCTSEAIYDAAQGWRRNECNRFAEPQKRDRCLKEEADRSYDAYRAGAASQTSH